MPVNHDTPEAAELDAKVLQLKNEGLTFREIADRLGYSAPSYMYRCYQRGIRRVVDPHVAEYRSNQLAEIEAERALLEEIIHAYHPVVSQGHIVSVITGMDDAGKPVYGDALEDAGPILAAMDRRAKLRAQEMDLLGLKAPVKVDATIYEVTEVEIELRELVQQQQARNDAAREALREQA